MTPSVTVIKALAEEIVIELERLMKDKFTGNLSLTVRLNQGGITAASMGTESNLAIR